jgi:hypothetical protein
MAVELTPDQIDFENRKLGLDVVMLVKLRSGRVAVMGADRKLQFIAENGELRLDYLLNMVVRPTLPEPPTAKDKQDANDLLADLGLT